MDADKIFYEVIEEITGSDVVPLFNLIKGKKAVSEFKLAEALNTTVNHVRNMLYRLNSYNLVDFVRKKDRRKGWYVYYWTLDMCKLRDLAVRIKQELIRMLRQRLKKEQRGIFFICPDNHIRASLESAMEYNFRCPECDLPLEKENNEKLIEDTKKQIEKLKKEIEFLGNLKIKPLAEIKLRSTRTSKKKRARKKSKTKVRKKASKRGRKKSKRGRKKATAKKKKKKTKKKRRKK